MPANPDAPVRRIEATDLAALGDLYSDSDGPGLEFLMAFFEQPAARGWLLEDSPGRPVGGAWFSVAADQADLVDIRLVSSARGLGGGRRLLAGSIDQLVEEGVRDIHLEVRRSNTIARGFYSGLGFEVVGERADYYQSAAGREDAILMVRFCEI